MIDQYAFPRKLPDITAPPDEALEIIRAHSGMTYRQWLAGVALQGMASTVPGGVWDKTATYEGVAKGAVLLADALIRELEQS